MMKLDFRFRLRRGDADIEVSESFRSQSTALFGPSGSGKSSILEVIAGRLRPRAGLVRIADTLIWDAKSGVDTRSSPRSVGYVPQCKDELIPILTVMGNLRLACWRSSEKLSSTYVDRVLSILNVDPFLNTLVCRLNSGQKRLVALACALVSRPIVLLFDEPLIGLGNPRFTFIPMLQSIVGELDIPLIFVTHNVTEIKALASWVLVLESGRVRYSGTPDTMSALT